MNIDAIAVPAPDEVERRMLTVGCAVWWSPQDAAYIAFSVEFPELVCADHRSSMAALERLEAEIRRALRSESVAA
ncbi:hypothetical protein [Nocardia inohanensis]|uniref:hypothetical protein n=1 Tax=Nocardia inohanensis TaxID=209246 RepID=UPI000830E63F|nr:hypothetical protein [Nocardia inohanensis]